jgi:DNA-binding PadR family transcriptional regulator
VTALTLVILAEVIRVRDGGELGEFEQLVLLAILNLKTMARAAEIRARIETAADRRVSRGALYATLDRLQDKGFLAWEVEEATPSRGGIPRRRFVVTKAGLAALRRSWSAVRTLARGLERLLGQA